MSELQVVPSNDALAAERHAAFQTLLVVCNRFENLDLPFYLDAEAATDDLITSFLAFDGSEMIGFAHIPDDPEPESCLMVHPDRRRQGIGSKLLGSMRSELRRRGLSESLLIADQASTSGKAFLHALGIPYRSSEYRLELDRARTDRSRPLIDGLTMRPASHADAETLAVIRAAAFGEEVSKVRDHIERGFNEKTRRFYLAAFDGQSAGTLRAGEYAGIGDITAFGVLSEFQGRGFGRRMLIDAIDLLTADGFDRIAIEVATENGNALGLYESCGFRVTSEYGFYTFAA